jgi:predicted dehydrogenase
MTFKIAVIGCGWVSTACHGPSYRLYADKNPGVELTGCCDIDLGRSQAFREQFGFARAYTDIIELLEVEKPTVVCLNVPEKLTCELGVKILERGHPLLTEKPAGMNAAEVDRLVNAARKANVPNMVAFNRRYMPLMMELKWQMAACEIHHIDYQMARIGRTGGDFSASGIHAVDAVRFLAGADYENVRFRYQELPALGKSVANFHLDCLFANGLTAGIDLVPVSGLNVERAIVSGHNHTFLLHCNNGFDAPGSLRHYEKGNLLLNLDGGEFSNTKEDYILSGFYAEDVAFFDALRNGTPIKDDIRSGRQSVEIMQSMLARAPEYFRKGGE